MMYLNEKTLAQNARSAKRKIIIGDLFCGFFTFGIIAALIDNENASLRGNIPFYILMMLPFIYLIYVGVRKQRLAGLCNRLNQAFLADADGIVPLNSILPIIGTSDEDKAEKIINKLISRGFLQNATFDPEKPHTIVLLGKSKTESILCPYCGANVERRTRYSVTCPYCKSVIG